MSSYPGSLAQSPEPSNAQPPGALLVSPMIDRLPLLRADGIRKSYAGVVALHDGRIELRPGSVHALCGGNGAGKSTFLSILTGSQQPDGGRILCRGRELRCTSPAAAHAAGIAIITQELSPLPNMTVAENIYLGREPRRAGCWVDFRAMERNAAALLERLRFAIDPRARVDSLALGQIQLVEIAKAISRDGSILIMDEPTSALGDSETRTLLDAIAHLRAQGVGIIYVSHRLTELFTIADHYTVFRDGRFVQTGALADIDRRELIRLIVGRALETKQRPQKCAAGAPLLEVTGFSRAGRFTEINLAVRRGEIVGLYGLLGAGRSAFATALYGAQPTDTGRVRIDGREVNIRSPADALRHGLAMVGEDRRATGLVPARSVRENISIAALLGVARFGFVSARRECSAVDEMVRRLGIRARSREQPVGGLSGGNQQKVVFARSLMTGPTILICDEPTRGIDEGAKREIYEWLAEFAASGGAVLMISSETAELLLNCGRILVFRQRRIAAELTGSEATPETLVHWAS